MRIIWIEIFTRVLREFLFFQNIQKLHCTAATITTTIHNVGSRQKQTKTKTKCRTATFRWHLLNKNSAKQGAPVAPGPLLGWTGGVPLMIKDSFFFSHSSNSFVNGVHIQASPNWRGATKRDNEVCLWGVRWQSELPNRLKDCRVQKYSGLCVLPLLSAGIIVIAIEKLRSTNTFKNISNSKIKLKFSSQWLDATGPSVQLQIRNRSLFGSRVWSMLVWDLDIACDFQNQCQYRYRKHTC